MKQIMTLAIGHKNGKLLLGMKKRKFGEGRWNGFGGKLYEGETIEQGLLREIKEEADIIPDDLVKMAIMIFEYQNTAQLIEVHLFKFTNWEGEPSESEEMRPQWFDEAKIPFDQMWPDDKYWMPYFLQNKRFRAVFTFTDYNTIISHEIKEDDHGKTGALG